MRKFRALYALCINRAVRTACAIRRDRVKAYMLRAWLALGLLLLAGCDLLPGPPTPTPAPLVTPSAPVATASPAPPTATTVEIPSPTAPALVTPAATETVAAPPTTAPTTPDARGLAPGCAQIRSAQTPRDGLGDALFPQIGNSGYDALHYTLDLAVDVDRNAISGTATLQAQALLD